MRRVRATALAALLVVTTVAATFGAPSGPAAAEDPCPGRTRATTDLGSTTLYKQAHPVVLVHGWTGSAMQPTRTLLEKQLPSDWQFLLFDYSDVNDHWASKPEIAACLAQFLRDVHDKHRAAGGDGRVFVVAHSMGGLATSYALNETYGQVPGLAKNIGGLVTIDTPWTGSPWGDTLQSYLAQWHNTGRLPGADSEAWRCLRSITTGGTGGCTTPAYMPRSVPVGQVAGDIVLRRSYFGFHAYDISLGSDAIVPDDSQLGYLGSAPGSALGLRATSRTVTCTEDEDSVIAAGGLAIGASNPVGAVIGALSGTESQLLLDGRAMDAIGSGRASPALTAFMAQVLFGSRCSHMNITTNGDGVAQVVALLKAQAATRPLVPTDLLNAPVPAYCQHKAGRLVDGELPLKSTDGSSPGYATVLDETKKKKFLAQPVTPDLTGDGVADLVGVLECSAGGVNWPQMLLAYTTGRDGPDLLTGLSLGDVTPAEHAQVTSLSSSGKGVAVRWTTYEGCCSYKKTWSATFRWNDKKLATNNLTQTSGARGARFGDPSNRIGFLGLGPIRLGMTTADVEALSDPALQLSPAGGGYCDSYTASGVDILLPGDPVHRVEWIAVRGGGIYSRIPTAKGIRIGSTLAEVKAAYPGGTSGPSQEMDPYYAVREGSNVLAFGIQGGVVSEIVAATARTFALDEICA